MANEKKQPAKKNNPNAMAKFAGGFKRFFGKIGNSFKNTWHELRKVTWPTKDKLVNYSIIVILMTVFMMLIIGLLDMGASSLIRLIMPKA